MKTHLRILHLEDNSLDAELVANALDSIGAECDIVRVQDRGEFVRALEGGGFDVILADYSLPSFDGMAALSVIRKDYPEIPYIFVSGTLGEDVAVESLKSGAADYVLKDRLSRLAPAVRRALGDAEERQARRQAESSLKKMNRVYAVLSSVNRLIVRAKGRQELFDDACRILVEEGLFRMAWIGLVDEASRTVKPVAYSGCEEGYLEKVTVSIEDVPEGRGPTGLVVRTGLHFINNDTRDNPAMLPWREKAVAHGYISSAAFPLITDGKVLGALTVYAAEAGFFDDDEVRLMDEMAADISHSLKMMEQGVLRERAEDRVLELGERLHALVEESSDVGAFIIQDGRVVFSNPAGYAMFGHEAGSMPGISELVHKNDIERAAGIYARMISGELKRSRNEFSCLKKDGSVFDAELFGFSSVFRGRPAVIGTIIDISERKRIEEALGREKSIVDGIMKATDVMLVYLDTDFNFVAVNPAYAETCKMRPEEMVGKNHFDLYPHEENEAIFRQVRDTGAPVFYKDKPFEFPDQPERGVTYWDWSLTPVKDSSGKVEGLVFSLHETTKRKLAEEALRKKNEKIWILEESARMLLSTDAPERIVQVLAEKVMTYLGCHVFFNYIVDEGKQRMRLNAWYGIPEETAKEIEYLDFGVAVCGCVARDGCRIVAEDIPNNSDERTELVRSFGIQAYACHPLVYQGKTIGTLSFGTCARTHFTEEELSLMKAVTDLVATAMARKRAEEELIRAKEEWERTFNSVPDMIAILDSNHRIIRVNEAMAKRLGMKPEECIGLPCYKYVHGLSGPPAFCPHTRTVKDGKLHVQEVHEDRLGGDFLVSTTPLFDENGAMTGSVHVAHDITARKQAERQRQDFYAMVTHDLKSPLTTILGYSELILSKGVEVSSQVLDFTKGIEHSGEKLLQMVEEFLAVSRLESGSITLHKAKTDITRLVSEGCRFFEVQAAKKGLELKCSVDQTPIEANIDAKIVEMALNNLVQNAINYTPSGGHIVVTAGKRPDGSDGAERLVISVSDTGRGIAPEEKERVFEKYYRLPGSGTKGSGLGLAIVKAVAEAHNGRVELESEPGKGSTFKLILPV